LSVARSRFRQALRTLMPDFIAPQLATLVAQAPAGSGWVHELKWDGYRTQIRIEEGEARIFTRRGHDWTARLPRLAQAAADLPVRSAILDTEMVVLDQEGAFQLQRLAFGPGSRRRCHHHRLRLRPALAERDRPARPIPARAQGRAGPAPERECRSLALLRALRRRGEPGLRERLRSRGRGHHLQAPGCAISLRAQRHLAQGEVYQPAGVRDGGLCAGRDDRTGLRGLVLAVHEGDRLVYAGRVGTGWDAREARELLRALKPRERDRSPLHALPHELRRGVVWVEPELVADVQYLHWKERTHLRHASYQGLREDRDPGSVVVELAA
jgi:bifunctional non-homologous end joining protein LigD